MSTPTVYVICDQNCKFEGMTKEQILTAIVQAVNEGTISNIDTGFVTTIKTINGAPLKFFVGEQSDYDALPEAQKKNLFAIITNDTTKEGIYNAIRELQTNYQELQKDHGNLKTNLQNGNFVVDRAEYLNFGDYASVNGEDSTGFIEIGTNIRWTGIYILTILKTGYNSTYQKNIPITTAAILFIGNRPNIDRLAVDAGCVDFRSSMMCGEFDGTNKVEFYARIEAYTHTDGKDYFYLRLEKASGGYINTNGLKFTLSRITI